MSWKIYVDGSYDAGCNKAAYAYALVRYNIRFMEGYGIVSETEGTRNIAGELCAVQEALNCIYKSPDNHDKEVIIHYDYIGIEKWATGEWRANIHITKKYADYIKKMCSMYKISFQKVKAHSGDQWNDYVDRLCRKAFVDAGIKS